MIAKFRYHSENFAIIAKICCSENFAMHSNFRYDSDMIAKFRYHSKISSLAKFWHCSSLATVPLLPAAFIHIALFHFFLL